MRIIFSIILIVLCLSCEQQPGSLVTEYQEPDRNWTVVVYMAADNDLEEYAITNFNQLEGVNYADSGVTVLALIDRGAGYDTTNGDWTDTRLYEIQTDPNGVDGIINSKRLSAPELGLSANVNTELDTGDYRTLRNTLKFAKKNYRAKNYALIVWGHGSGWRSSPTPQTFAMGFDDNADTYITNPELRLAVSDMDLSIVSFDTCFGGLLEIAYELKDEVKSIIGSPGLAPAIGWTYDKVFSQFIKTPQTIADFEQAVIQQFQAQNATLAKAAISAINLSHIDDVKVTLDTFSLALANCITSETERKTVKAILLDEKAIYDGNSSPSSPSDLFIDIYDMTENVKAKIDTITTDPAKKAALQTAITNLQGSLKQSITNSWKQGSPTSYTMSVHIIPRIEGIPATPHDRAYIKGSGVEGQSKFVKDSTGWVPTKSSVGSSLLDKLFYTLYP